MLAVLGAWTTAFRKALRFGKWQLLCVSALSRWTKSFKNLFESFTQLTLRLGLIRGLASLIRKLDRVGKLPRPNPDLHRGYHARADFRGRNSYLFSCQRMKRFTSRLIRGESKTRGFITCAR